MAKTNAPVQMLQKPCDDIVERKKAVTSKIMKMIHVEAGQFLLV